MTINEAIAVFDAEVPNQYSRTEKIKWLDACDRDIYENIILPRQGAEMINFNGYCDDSVGDTQLLVLEPYTDIYRFWLEAQVDFSNREHSAFNNAMTMYAQYYSNFTNAYFRKHSQRRTGGMYV